MRLNLLLSYYGAFCAGLVQRVVAGAVPRDSSSTATIRLDTNTGWTAQLGAGFIYGFPDNGTSVDNSIPDKFLWDMRFNIGRAGGAQVSAAGWAYGGLESYKGRFESTLSNYRTIRKYHASFILLPHDLWGAQGGASADTPFPGDNGNWSEMENFIRHLVSDILTNDMLDGLVIDLWNEPDLEGFWARPWSQYVEYYIRATHLVRTLLPGFPISGPSMAHSPHADDVNWQAFLSGISTNNAVPDIYSWHQIGAWEREPDTTIPAFSSLRATFDLPERPIHVNEYAWPSEQNPANSVYYIAQCERHNIRGLRANWGGGSELHDYMANLLWKANGQYYPNGEWQLYKYYGNMVGERLATTASTDLAFDVFAVRDGDIIKVIAGTRTVKRDYAITITGFGNIGRAREGSIGLHTLRFDWNGAKGQIDAPADLGFASYSYADDTLTIQFNPPTDSTALAFEFQLP